MKKNNRTHLTFWIFTFALAPLFAQTQLGVDIDGEASTLRIDISNNGAA